MTTATSKICCITCKKDRTSANCSGCLQYFCYKHLIEHRQQFTGELDGIENDGNIFREILSEQIKDPMKHSSIQLINHWEKRSHEKIQQTANQAREFALNYLIPQHLQTINNDLKKFTNEIKEIRVENDYNEIILKDLRDKLNELIQQLDRSEKLSVREDLTKPPSVLINRIFVSCSPRTCVFVSNDSMRFDFNFYLSIYSDRC